MYKFRTMVRDPQLAVADAASIYEAVLQARDDPRLTSVGRFLRRSAWTNCRSLERRARRHEPGRPRPLPVEQVEANPELLGQRHEVRAGMTGWWQISGRSEVSVEEALDLFYIENWSLTFDLYVLLKTAGAVLSRKGAY